MNKKLITFVAFVVLGFLLWQVFDDEGSGFRQNDLTDVPWVWTETKMADGQVVKPKQVGQFVLTFGSDGNFSAQTDCNGHFGAYELSGSDIIFSQMGSTLMYCFESQEAEFADMLTKVESFDFDEQGNLILSLSDLGSMFFVKKQTGEKPSDEEAELTAFNFILDFIKVAPPESDLEAEDRVYNVLSSGAKEQVSRENIVRDLALFVGVQDVPDQGASVEDLQVGEESAVLIVGLNYSGGRVLKDINLVIEDGEWKVDSVTENESFKQ